MATLKVETLDILVTRKVVQVTKENIEDRSLENFLASYKIVCRNAFFSRNHDEESGTCDRVAGVEYYESQNPYPEKLEAAIGDYIVVLGHKEAYTLTPEELSEKQPEPASETIERREPKLLKDSKVWLCRPQNRLWLDGDILV